MFTIATREDQGPPLPQSGFPPVGADGLACGFGYIVGVDVLGDPQSLPLGGRWIAEGKTEGECENTARTKSDYTHSPSVTCGASFSLRLGHARGKTIINRFLTPSRRFATQGEGFFYQMINP